MIDLDLGLEFDEKPKKDVKRTARRTTACIKRIEKTIYRRAYSETQLLDAIGINIKNGETYHCMTGGDVDSLSYLKAILRHQSLDYCLFSTWCMACDDVLQFEEWLEKGQIKRLDAYVGEIFKNSYSKEYSGLMRIFDKFKCGRIAAFRNHAKIYAGIGSAFPFGIETSANINTNPRTENGCISTGMDIFLFYKDFFDQIIPFNKDDFPKWRPYAVPIKNRF